MHLIEKAGTNFFLRIRRKKVLKFFLLMKLTAVFFLVGAFCVSAKGFTQQVTLRLKNATLQQTFREIQRQTGFTFLYTKQMVENAPRVDVVVTNVTLQEAMNECLKKQLLDYFIENKTVIIRRKAKFIPISTNQYSAPADTTEELHGVVLSETNSPLQGATVRIMSLDKSTHSNAKGEFVLTNVPKGKYRIEISYVGFDDFVATINVNGNTGNITAALKQVLSRLDEVQVIAYGTTTKRFTTGDQTALKTQEIEKQPVSNPLQAIQGRMAGVLVTSANGIPGSGITMQIRGNYSLSSPNNPLYIVDGVPIPATSISNVNTASGAVSPLNSISPNDIESISVLKDADATSIYGSRGANGVVLITTKKGKAGKTKFDVNAYSGSSVATRIPEFLNTEQYLDIRRKAFAADKITPTNSNAQDLLLWDQTAYTNFPKMILGNTAPFTNVQSGVTGGSESTRILVSLGYHNEGSIIYGDNYDKRVSGHLNVDHYSTDKKLNINTSVTYTNDNIKTLAADPFAAIYSPPNFPQYDSTGALYWIARDAQANTANPWSYLNRVGKTLTDNVIANTALKYTVLPGLNAKMNVGFTKMFMSQQVTQPTTSYNPTSTSSTKSLASFGNSSVQTYIVEPQFDYSRNIAQGVLNVMAGGTAQSSLFKSNSITGTNFSTDDLIESIGAAANITARTNTSSQYKYISGFGRLNFRWMDKYIVNGTFRRDGSTRFGPGKKFGNFWSVGGAWIFSQENILKNNLSVFSFGKVRASYGTTGSDQISDYRYLELYSNNTSALPYNGSIGLYASQIGNPVFGWEENRKLEVAMELGFVNNRFLLTGTWYRNRSDNQLVQSPLPTQTGFEYYQANLPALIQMTSWEVELNSTNISTRDFRWQTVFNITFPDSKLLDYPNFEASPYAQKFEIGKPLILARGYHYTGLSDTGVPTIEDVDKNGSLSFPNDYVTIGSLSPQYYGGMGNSFTWKGFSLDIFLQFTKQNGYNARRSFYFPPGYKVNVPTFFVKDYWEASNPDATQPALTTSASSAIGSIMLNRLYISDYAYSDASYLRLKNLSFSYSLPKKITDKISVQNLRIYIQGQNLYTFTKYEGLDPETQNATPVLKTLTGGIQLTF
jgi:TonB-linked SusC/RagA family outer membrane protein